MPDVTFAGCEACGAEGELELPAVDSAGPLACPNCGDLINTISVVPWHRHIEQRVAQFAAKQRSGQTGTRKQSIEQSDSELDRDGLQAELAACLLLCPGQRQQWLQTSGPNRGSDLPHTWTQLPKPVEVKQTRYRDERRGFLLVRPPRRTPGPMRPAYIDDSLYLLLHGHHGLFTLLGWTDREHLIGAGCLNPVPVRPGQRECWGLHWSRLRPLRTLFDVPQATKDRPCTTPSSPPSAPLAL